MQTFASICFLVSGDVASICTFFVMLTFQSNELNFNIYEAHFFVWSMYSSFHFFFHQQIQMTTKEFYVKYLSSMLISL